MVEIRRETSVLTLGGSVVNIPNDRAARAKVLADPQGIPSPLYRLEVLGACKPWDEVLPRWLSHHRNDMLKWEDERRLYARSVIAAGRADLAEGLGVSEAEKIREQGWALTRGQKTDGGLAIAVPISKPSGEVAALGVYGPEVRCSTKREQDRWRKALLATAAEINEAATRAAPRLPV